MKICAMIISMAAVSCAFSLGNARAQTTTNEMDATNLCKFILEVYVEGPAKTTNNEITFSQEKPEIFTDVDGTKEIDAATGHSYSTSQVLAKIGWNFWVLDKANSANSYMVSSNMIFGYYSPTKVKSGTRNNITGQAEGPFEYLKLYTLTFNTVGASGGHQYNFFATGFEKKITIDGKITNPTLGTFPQKDTATIMKMSGYGYKGSLNILIGGNFSEKGAGIKQLGSWTGPTSSNTWGSAP